jgi:hypothetical protein
LVQTLALAATMSSVCAETTVLVEAESLASRGGWQVDTLSVEQMGSPYLIAHGLGVPVTDATASIAFPVPGDYAVWVRTRNWVPAFSNSAAPGRFLVRFNGVDLAPTFGATGSNWHWQSGGTVSVAGASAAVALRDLTGFDGRCDALAFISGSGVPPPDGGPALDLWRRAAVGEAGDPPQTNSFDCVVVGGGMAGCCAAVAAARSGVRVALVQDRPVLGGNASQEIRVATRGEIRHPIVDELDTTPLANRDDGAVAADAQRLATIQAETNITLFMPWRAYGAGTNAGGRITHVDVRETRNGERRRLQGTLFIDCTGDGWIGYWAGADFSVGREAAATYGESLAPATADAKTMGNTLMWKTRTAAGPVSFPAVPWALEVAGTRADTGGDWNWEYGLSLDTIADAEHIRDHLLRAIYGNFWNAKQKPAHTNLALAWVPHVAGKRESRRLLGDHILTQSDVQNGVYFEDAIATTDWGIDLHYETAVSYLTSYRKTSIKKCYFPFRSLYSRNVPNLLMAGRCFSCSHVGIGSPRVQNTTAQMGVAVGFAAALCKQYGIEPRDIYRSAERTVELQARISGTWPARPPPAGSVILDNTNAAPAVALIGPWTSSTSVTGFYGSSYLLDGNTGKGARRVAFTPSLPYPGDYTIALRWAADANRATNTPVWVLTDPQTAGLPSTADRYIRNAQPDTISPVGEMLVGRFAASDYARGLLAFDLSSVPSNAVIVSAELQLEIAALDTNSAEGFVGADGLKVYQVTTNFTPAEASWNSRSAGAAWAAAGGDFDPVALCTIPTPTDPNLAEAGDVFAFPHSDALTAAAQAARRQGTPLGLLVRTPTLESTYPVRKLYRFGAATLTLGYHQPQLPAPYTVNQRVNGGHWIPLGAHTLPPGGFTVVVGNDGTSGYVVGDAVQFYNAAAGTNDYDGDGLSDAWERYYFLSLTAAQPGADADEDGRSNFIEAMTGTDPTDAASRFDMRSQLEAPTGHLLLQWPSATGRTYRIEASSDLRTFVPVQTGVAATPPTNQLSVVRDATNAFYRVLLE